MKYYNWQPSAEFRIHANVAYFYSCSFMLLMYIPLFLANFFPSLMQVNLKDQKLCLKKLVPKIWNTFNFCGTNPGFSWV